MIASLSGVVKSSGVTNAIIEVGGVGILVQVTAKTAGNLRPGTAAQLYTSLVVREDSLTLFGFETSAAREMFETLQTVSGIGPKVALSALSIYEPNELASAIYSGENSLLERIPGLGKKGAQRVVLELRDKVTGNKVPKGNLDWHQTLDGALTGLGFTTKDIEKIFKEVSDQVGDSAATMNPSELLKLALQIKGRG
jgi:holliday junction DNA helicase RuvA